MNWSILTAATGGALIEFLEIAVIAYAIAGSGYPREALLGSLVGIGAVSAIAIPFSAVLPLIPLNGLEILVGATLVWFGGRWVRKSVQRQVEHRRAGWLSGDPLQAEGIVLDSQGNGFNWLNFTVTAKSACLETCEVAILVVTLGTASQTWFEPLLGTGIASGVALILVALLHPYLRLLPDVWITLGAGTILCALGTFWLGEGLGVSGMTSDLAILVILVIYSAAISAALAWLSATTDRPTPLNPPPPHP